MAKTAFTFAMAEMMRAYLLQGEIEVWAVDAAFWTPAPATDKYFSVVPTSARVKGPVLLTSRTVSDGAVFDHADFVFTPVTGPSVEHIVFVLRLTPTSIDSVCPILFVETGSEGLPTPALTAGTISGIVDSGSLKAGAVENYPT